jgi:hypothetical protein
MFNCGIIILDGIGGGLEVFEEFGCGTATPREPTHDGIFAMRSLSSSCLLTRFFISICSYCRSLWF